MVISVWVGLFWGLNSFSRGIFVNNLFLCLFIILFNLFFILNFGELKGLLCFL